MFENVGQGQAREMSMQCHKIEFPGRNLDTLDDTNIYGPTRNVVNSFSFGDITTRGVLIFLIACLLNK